MKSESFLKFFTPASKLMEVAITEDIFTGTDNYTEDPGQGKEAAGLTVHRVFHDEKWSKGRAVTSLDWYLDLLLYSAQP